MKKQVISDDIWLQLYNFKDVIAKKLITKFPSNWKITTEIIADKAWSVILHYIDTYKSGKTSLTSYIFTYAEMATYRDLYAEYRKRTKQIDLEDIENCLSDKKSVEKEILLNDYCRYIYKKCSKLQQKILDLFYIGYTQKEISKILKVSESQISKEINKIKVYKV